MALTRCTTTQPAVCATSGAACPADPLYAMTTDAGTDKRYCVQGAPLAAPTGEPALFTRDECVARWGPVPVPVPPPSHRPTYRCRPEGGCEEVHAPAVGPFPTLAACVAKCDCSPGPPPDAEGPYACVPAGATSSALCGRAWVAARRPAAWLKDPACVNNFATLQAAVDYVVSRFDHQGGARRLIVVANGHTAAIWPGLGPEAGPDVWGAQDLTGFDLLPGEARAVPVAVPWVSGRVWARVGCVAGAAAGSLSCATGTCGSDNLQPDDSAYPQPAPGTLSCRDTGGKPPASLAELTLLAGYDTYDTSAVDGVNLPVAVVPYRSADGTARFLPAPGQTPPQFACMPSFFRFASGGAAASCPRELLYRTAGAGAACASICSAVSGATTATGALEPSYAARLAPGGAVDADVARRLGGMRTQPDVVHGRGTYHDLVCASCSMTSTTAKCEDPSTPCNFGCSPYGPQGGRGCARCCPAWPGTDADTPGPIQGGPWAYGVPGVDALPPTGVTAARARAPPPAWPPTYGAQTMAPDWPAPIDAARFGNQPYPLAIAQGFAPGSNAYLWQFNDMQSTFQCTAGDYLVVFAANPDTWWPPPPPAAGTGRPWAGGGHPPFRRKRPRVG